MKTLRTLAILVIVAGLVLTTAGSALAQGDTPQVPLPGRPFTIRGLVTAQGAAGFDVRARSGTVIVAVNDQTRFRLTGQGEVKRAELRIGDQVDVVGRVEGTIYTARLVQVAARRPIIRYAIGQVSAYQSGSSITVKPVSGEPATFAINANTHIRYLKGVTQVSVGDRVAVVGGQAPGKTAVVARIIVVIPAASPSKKQP